MVNVLFIMAISLQRNLVRPCKLNNNYYPVSGPCLHFFVVFRVAAFWITQLLCTCANVDSSRVSNGGSVSIER